MRIYLACPSCTCSSLLNVMLPAVPFMDSVPFISGRNSHMRTAVPVLSVVVSWESGLRTLSASSASSVAVTGMFSAG